MRWLDNSLEAREDFIGMHEIESTQARVLHSMVKDVLCRLDILVKKLRGQCYDGGASMSGYRGGLAECIQEEEPCVVHTHCYEHALNLACSDALKECKLMRISLNTLYEIINFVKKSPHYDAVFQNIKQKMQGQLQGICVICPTRWTARAEAFEVS